MTISELMLPELDREMERTHKVLAAIPANKMDWKPAEDLRSIGWNANHLAEIVGWAMNILDQSEFDIAPPGEAPYETPEIEDPHEIVAIFKKNVSTARDAISKASDDLMAETWSLKMGGQTLQTLSKGECLRAWVFNHTVHHRAILSVYLRMAGVELTPVYDG